QIHLAGAKRADDGRRQRVDVDLEAVLERGFRIELADDLVHAEHVRPQLFVAEGVVTEDLLALIVASGPWRAGQRGGEAERKRSARDRQQEAEAALSRKSHVSPFRRSEAGVGER